MPTKTFFNLTKEKQERLLAAAKKEFSRAPLQEASINNIIKTAEISRGSFYQYFEDKKDLYYFYLKNLRRDTKKNLEKMLKEEDGDLFKALENYFRKIIVEVLTGANAAFYKNLFLHMDYHATNRVSSDFVSQGTRETYEKRQVVFFEKFIELIDSSKLKIKESDEIIMLCHMIFSLFFSSINDGYRQELKQKEINTDEILEKFSTRIKWLKYGVYQKEEG